MRYPILDIAREVSTTKQNLATRAQQEHNLEKPPATTARGIAAARAGKPVDLTGSPCIVRVAELGCN